MAKVIGPLFSQEARGQFAKTAVFRRRRGQNVVSSYVEPANPNTAAQQGVRDKLAVVSALIARIKAENLKLTSETETFVQYGRENAVGAEVWPNVVSRITLGAALATINASITAYAALGDPQKTVWQNDATGAPANFQDIDRPSGTSFTAGEQSFILQRAFRLAGYGAAWNAAAPTPEAYVSV